MVLCPDRYCQLFLFLKQHFLQQHKDRTFDKFLIAVSGKNLKLKLYNKFFIFLNSMPIAHSHRTGHLDCNTNHPTGFGSNDQLTSNGSRPYSARCLENSFRE